MIFIIIYSLIIFKIMLQWLNDPCRTKRDIISIMFAPPGCGKSTTAALMISKYTKKKITCYANFDCKGAIRIKWKDVGKYNFENSVVFIDEAGIDVNNRKYMDMAIEQIEYLKKHRHYRCEMWFFSQSHEDIDVTVRRLAQNYYVVSRTLLNRFTHKFYFKRAVKKIGIDKDTHQFIDYYEWVLFSKYKFNGKKYWGMFDSFDTSDLPDFPQIKYRRKTVSASDQIEEAPRRLLRSCFRKFQRRKKNDIDLEAEKAEVVSVPGCAADGDMDQPADQIESLPQDSMLNRIRKGKG